ncbi:hypothetical protein HETIRDRAFT_47109, partial [Heterobasidion irregulare TC 32-1]
ISPPSTIIIFGIYKTYLKNLQPSQVPQPLIVAKESSALRPIIFLVNHQQKVECTINLGSQVITMLEGICNKLALIYNPKIILNIQLANSKINRSLGLACNIPFLISDIILYLQVYVIQNPAYNVLLCCPFDILTKNIVKNYLNEDQTIAISDLNMGQ